MKILNIIILLLFSTACFSQVSIDKTLGFKYNSLLKKLDKELRENAAQMESQEDYSGSYVLYTQFKIDTLNNVIRKVKKQDDIIITNLDGTPITQKNKEFPFANIDFCGANFSNSDTLKIEIGYPFSSKSILHSLYKDSVLTNINIYFKNDSILKLKATDSNYTNEINLGVSKILFKVSDTTFSINKYVYCYAEIITNDFFQIDDYDKNKKWHLRYKMKYYFKIRRTKNST